MICSISQEGVYLFCFFANLLISVTNLIVYRGQRLSSSWKGHSVREYSFCWLNVQYVGEGHEFTEIRLPPEKNDANAPDLMFCVNSILLFIVVSHKYACKLVLHYRVQVRQKLYLSEHYCKSILLIFPCIICYKSLQLFFWVFLFFSGTLLDTAWLCIGEKVVGEKSVYQASVLEMFHVHPYHTQNWLSDRLYWRYQRMNIHHAAVPALLIWYNIPLHCYHNTFNSASACSWLYFQCPEGIDYFRY